MLQRKKRLRRGSITVLSAFFLVIVVGMIAFALDLGVIVNTRSELQNVADAAALAGGSKLLDRNMLMGGNMNSAAIQSIHSEARNYALRNKAGNVSINLGTNSGNSLTGDVVVGYLPNVTDSSSSFTVPASNYNAVMVTARRTSQQNGLMPLFFSGIFGMNNSSLTATATAVYDSQIKGFKITGKNPKVTNSKLLPFALHVDTWNKMTNGIGDDIWNYDTTTKKVVSGSDSIKEAKLYGSKIGVPGNFGTINIGSSSNGTNDIIRQIIHGPSKSDFDLMGGSFELSSSGTLTASGDPGLSAAVKSALESIIGQPRIIPLYSTVSGNGGNATYTIVGFGGAIITQVRLTGPGKSVTIQPEFVVDPTAFGGATTTTGGQTFTYRPLQLAR